MVTDKSKDTEQAPPKETVIIIRPSFKKICGKDACRAALFNHLLYCVACKVVGGSDYWYGTLDDIHKGIDESWSMGKMRKELEALVEQGLIGQRHNEAKKWDRTMQYFFSEKEAKILKEICKKEDVDLSSIGLPSQVTHLLNLTNAFAKYNKSIKQIKQMDLSNMSDPFVNNGGAIPKVTTKVLSKVTTKVTDSRSANTPATTAPSQKKAAKPKEKTPPTQKPLIPEITLTEEGQRFYDLYCSLRFIKVPPKITEASKADCDTLAPNFKTDQDLYDFKNFMDTHKFFKGKGFSFGMMIHALNDYAVFLDSSRPKEDAPTTTPTHTKKQPKPDHEIVFWTTDPTGVSSKHSNPLSWDYMTVAEAKAQNNGYKDGRLLIPIDEDNVKADKITLQQQQARKVAVNA